jgi:hypothetical protein
MRPPGAVRVTAGHITKGRRGDPHGCAIALAILGACPEASSIHVGGPTVVVSASPWETWTAMLPPEAHEFIGQFDRRRWRKPKPVTFTLLWHRGPASALARSDLVVAA